MFEQTLLAQPGGHRVFGTFAGVAGQALFAGALILAPLVFPQVLPQVQSLTALVAPGPPPPPPVQTVRPRGTVVHHLFRCTFCEPVAIPKRVAQIVDDVPDAAPAAGFIGVPGVVGDGVPGGVLTGILASRPAPIPPPQPVTAAPRPVDSAPAPVARYPVGGDVKPATLIRRVDPVYPALAKQARVSGVVELEGVIGVDGRVHELKVKSGPALLVKAAVDAVSQWLYQPTKLNGQPVEVIMPVTVTFRLN